MKKSLLWLSSLCLLFSATLFVSCDDDNDDATELSLNIVEFATSNPNYSLLAEAVVKAELDDALSGNGPFTLFAPTNDVFQTFLDGAGTNTVENTPKEILVQVLTNHVIAGEFKASDLSTRYYTTLSATEFGDEANTSIFINTDGGVSINGTVGVAQADVEVSNGVIHVIDEVIAPPTVVTFALADPNFSSLVTALTANGLTTNFVSVLSGNGPFTVFAPNNEAFEALLNSNDSWSVVADIPVEVLESVLLYHVTNAGNVRSTQLSDGQQVTTLSNSATFSIDLTAGPNPMIMAGSNTAEIIATDVQATNGVIHAINAVILP